MSGSYRSWIMDEAYPVNSKAIYPFCSRFKSQRMRHQFWRCRIALWPPFPIIVFSIDSVTRSTTLIQDLNRLSRITYFLRVKYTSTNTTRMTKKLTKSHLTCRLSQNWLFLSIVILSPTFNNICVIEFRQMLSYWIVQTN